MRQKLWCICAAAFACATLPPPFARAAAPRPNIIHIFADDLGWGSVGYNGQTQIATPNIDALAASGMRLTNAYACAVCAPSRAMLLTGFHQGHASVDGNDDLSGGFRDQDVMTAQVLEPAGYTSAIIGKWGFGADGVRSLTGGDPTPSVTAASSLPTSHGFSTFYGYLNHGAAHDYFYDWMWHNDSYAPQGVSVVANDGGPGGSSQYSHDLFAAQSEQFVGAHAGDDNPFYLQMNYTIPHWDIDAIANAPGGFGIYANMPWTTQQKAYAAMITRMDSSIGSLIARLDDPNNDGDHSDSVASNTLVLFTSDNGPSTEDSSPVDFFDANGQYRGGKFELYEGGIHMPAVAYWPGTIAPSSESDYRTDLSDFMATAADLAGVEAPVGIDGTSIASVLTGAGHQRQRHYLVFEHQGSHGADADPRIGRWSVVRHDGMKLIRYDNETTELFNLNSDPDENSPLSLGVPTNAQIAAELEAYAIAEGVTRGVVQYRTWSGPNGGSLHEAQHWSAPSGPDNYWSAVVANAGAVPAIAHVSTDVTTLGVEIRGQTALQVVNVHAGRTLTGRNEVRIGALGRVDLDDGTLATNRWVNIRAGGQVDGRGTIVGDMYNEGVVAPGQAGGDPAWPTAEPPALPAADLNTGVVNAATIDFTGVQDNVPVAQTSTLSPYAQVTHGLDFGLGVGPRWGSGSTNAGNELNVIGHNAGSLAQAIANADYVTFTITPVDGAAAIPDSVSFRLWRNGGAAAKNFAILSSVNGFTSGAALVQSTITDTGSGNQHVLTASIPAVADALSGPIEFRLYAWGATAATGNTHVNAASLDARFVGVSTLEFDFRGVQDQGPLTALRRQNANLMLTQGLSFGPGTAPSGANNAGDEFNVAGLSTGSTLQSAIDGGDYLSFEVQPIAGMATYPDSVGFTLWRQASGSAADYAILSSIGGFSSGHQLAQAHFTTVGSGNRQVFTAGFQGAEPVTDPVEIRLYGWSAGSALDSAHVVAASMRARFASVVGNPIDPTGALAVQGDFYHLAGGVLAIDLGGHTAGFDYDVIHVTGKVELQGDLDVSLISNGESLLAPSLGDVFSILTATSGITGQFANVALPELSAGLTWQIDYLPTAVQLAVYSAADFNRNRRVDASDYTLWRDSFGMEGSLLPADADGNGVVDSADYDVWKYHFGEGWPETGGGSSAGYETNSPVPEPQSPLLWGLGSVLLFGRSRMRGGRFVLGCVPHGISPTFRGRNPKLVGVEPVEPIDETIAQPLS